MSKTDTTYIVDRTQPQSVQMATMLHYMRQALTELADTETELRAELEEQKTRNRSLVLQVERLNHQLEQLENQVLGEKR